MTVLVDKTILGLIAVTRKYLKHLWKSVFQKNLHACAGADGGKRGGGSGGREDCSFYCTLDSLCFPIFFLLFVPLGKPKTLSLFQLNLCI